MSKLSIEDLEFIQPPNEPPAHIQRFGLGNWVANHKNSFLYYLKQNLLLDLLIKPRFTSTRLNFRPLCLDPHEGQVFLFNQGVARGTAHHGLSCVSLDIEESPSLSAQVECDIEKMVPLVKALPEDSDLVIRFGFWDKGRVDRERLLERLANCVRYALWETVTEVTLTQQSIGWLEDSDQKGCYGRISPTYKIMLNTWIPFGLSLKTPSLTLTPLTAPFKISLEYMIKELVLMSRTRLWSTEPFVFLANEENEADLRAVNKVSTGLKVKHAYLLIKPKIDTKCSPRSSHKLLKFKPNGCDSEQSMPPTPSVASPIGSFHQSPDTSTDLAVSERYSRQSLIVVRLETQTVEITSYNVGKDESERLNQVIKSYMSWLSARTSVAMSISAQKLGIFSNQAFTRPHAGISPINHFRELINSPAYPRAVKDSKSKFVPLNCFQDVQRYEPLHDCPRKPVPDRIRDVTKVHGKQMIATSQSDLEKLAKLFMVLQKRGGDTVNDDGLAFLLKHSRMMHFCLTPILFLPMWRYMVRATRFKKTMNRKELLSISDRLARRERNHDDLVKIFVKEYCQYVQSFGFSMVRLRSGPKGVRDRVQFLQKCLPSGLLIFEVGICKPFCYNRIYVLEESRISSKIFVDAMDDTSVVEEFDDVKNRMHLHSFTFDFHLRIVQAFVIDRPLPLRKGYNLVSFLSDFIRYYNKGPIFARNMAKTFQLKFDSNVVHSEQLWNYLLSHESDYGFGVLRMEPEFFDPRKEFKCDYVLVQQRTHRY